MGTPRKKPNRTKKQPPPPTPKQPQPWDPPPSSTVGDPSEEITYAAVGLALTKWGLVEHQLGEIFLALIGGRSYEAMMAFGSIMSGRGRAEMIVAAAKVYFITRTAPEHLETKQALADLMYAVGKFADRRNEIAHGVVKIQIGLDFDAEVEGGFKASFVLAPSYFAAKKRRMQVTESGLVAMPPSYEYSSKEIVTLSRKFHRLVSPAATISRQLRRQRHLERQASLQKPPEPAADQ
jgi:hypothetical protein